MVRSQPAIPTGAARFEIHPTDQRWPNSSTTSNPECLCSRCLHPIHLDIIPIRAWLDGKRFELRYHPACMGF